MKPILIGFGLSCALVACKDAGGPGGWFPDDIDEDAALDSASASAKSKVCDAFADYIYDMYRNSLLVEIACTVEGVENTTDASACADHVAECIDTPPPEAVSLVNRLMSEASCTFISYEPTGCSKTISDLRACLDALEGEIDQLQYTVTCAAAGSPVGTISLGTPAACSEIENACPTL